MFVTSSLTAPPRQKPEVSVAPAFVDNPFAPEMFVTGFAGFCHVAGVIQLTLDNLRCDHTRPDPAMERVIVGRVALPVAVAQSLVTSLNAFLEEQGCSPSKAAAAGASFQ